ncbi:MAG: ATP-binding protein [Alphaproteobacteria bacterium]|nr:ATP-binding protein [Alphaproteobacteria bacterium]
MPPKRITGKRRLRVALSLALPAALVFGVLGASDALPWWQAVLGWLATAALSAILLRAYLARLRAAIEIIATKPSADDIDPRTDVLGMGAILRLMQRALANKDGAIARLEREGDTILDSLPDAVLLIDRELMIRRGNKAALRLFDINIVGRGLTAVLRGPELLDAVGLAVREAKRGEIEIELAGRGWAIELRANIEPLPRHAGDETWAILALHDQTERKRTERLRADFVANASHELRTPLSTLVGFIKTLSSGAADDAATRNRFLTIMDEQADRMARLVGDLMSLSRIEMGESDQPTDRIELADLAHSTVEALQLKAQARGISLTLKIETGLPPVLGDEDELAQLIQNLVDNAIKYSRPNTTVEIALTRTETPPSMAKAAPHGVLRIAVKDQGKGIPREHLPRLTERFYRVDAARSHALGGTGLGLAIVKHITNHHRGLLSIDSTLGEGSTFAVQIPAANPNDARSLLSPRSSRTN